MYVCLGDNNLQKVSFISVVTAKPNDQIFHLYHENLYPPSPAFCLFTGFLFFQFLHFYIWQTESKCPGEASVLSSNLLKEA